LADLAAGRLKLLFVSPERLASPAFRRLWAALSPRPEVPTANHNP
jgi:superfamily II DNA helicase RecQ